MDLHIETIAKMYHFGAVNGIIGILKEEAEAIINIWYQPVPQAKGRLAH